MTLQDRGPPRRRVGDYLLGAELGSGGMGTVYRGRHVETGVEHAIKVLATLDPTLLGRFRREAEALAALSAHPHGVRIHAFGEDRGRLWLALARVGLEKVISHDQLAGAELRWLAPALGLPRAAQGRPTCGRSTPGQRRPPPPPRE